jgi:3-oxoacyl-[acyl-carrier protein] reductase
MSTPPSRRALVTGGSGEIGGAICRQLAADGLHVVVHANGNLARAQATVAEIAAAGTACRLSLGAQQLTLRRVDGGCA